MKFKAAFEEAQASNSTLLLPVNMRGFGREVHARSNEAPPRSWSLETVRSMVGSGSMERSLTLESSIEVPERTWLDVVARNETIFEEPGAEAVLADSGAPAAHKLAGDVRTAAATKITEHESERTVGRRR